MRKTFNDILKQSFHCHLVRYRSAHRLTVTEMADTLAMEPRSYMDLDHGRTACTALTLARFLIYCCDDPRGFLDELRMRFEAAEEEAA